MPHDGQATIGQVPRAQRDDLLLPRFRKANASAINRSLGGGHSNLRAAVNNAWLYWPAICRPTSARLFCFPHAGVGAAVFRLWPVGLPVELEMCGVQLPGRTTRLAEPAVTSLPMLADAVAQAITPYIDIPFAFFGHSMGAVLAAEVTRTLAASGLALPRHLFVSGRRPPHVPDPELPLSGLSDAEFVAEINRRYGGIPPAILQNQGHPCDPPAIVAGRHHRAGNAPAATARAAGLSDLGTRRRGRSTHPAVASRRLAGRDHRRIRSLHLCRRTFLPRAATGSSFGQGVGDACADDERSQIPAAGKMSVLRGTHGDASVAIVGIGCRFPGGVTDAASFWHLLSEGRDAITEIPLDRIDVGHYFDPRAATPGRMTTRWGGFLDRIDEFDADFFGISPREAERLDPAAAAVAGDRLGGAGRRWPRRAQTRRHAIRRVHRPMDQRLRGARSLPIPRRQTST